MLGKFSRSCAGFVETEPLVDLKKKKQKKNGQTAQSNNTSVRQCLMYTEGNKKKKEMIFNNGL